MTSARILVVEDEPALAQALKQALTESGYAVTVAFDGREGFERICSERWDLAILDLMLPHMHGFEIIKAAREKGADVPILVLTAKDKLQDKVEGLDLGADDYVIKPFDLSELLARIRVRLRRGAEPATLLEYGDLKLDTVTRQVTRAGKRIYLSATEFMMLELLVRNAEKPVPKKTLLDKVWGEDSDRNDNVVEVYANYLRGKIERWNLPKIIHTVRGKGYMVAKNPALVD